MNDKNLPRHGRVEHSGFEPTYDKGEGSSSSSWFTNYLRQGSGRDSDDKKFNSYLG